MMDWAYSFYLPPSSRRSTVNKIIDRLIDHFLFGPPLCHCGDRAKRSPWRHNLNEHGRWPY